MNQDEIRSLLPHRAPMLLVDEIEEIEPGVRAVGIKHVRADEFWCSGHFPGDPILPGVLLAEAMAQVGGVVYMATQEQAGGGVYLLGFDKIRFRKPVRPGDRLRMEVAVVNQRRSIWTFSCEARVGDDRVANGTFLATVASKPDV